ncbi:MAG: KTSC domain-containing protein [Rhodanobacteraceae bacterium]
MLPLLVSPHVAVDRCKVAVFEIFVGRRSFSEQHNPAMDVVRINSPQVEKASFAARLHRLRVAFKNGRVTDYSNVSPGLFNALTRAADPDHFLETRIEGTYESHDVIREIEPKDA